MHLDRARSRSLNRRPAEPRGTSVRSDERRREGQRADDVISHKHVLTVDALSRCTCLDLCQSAALMSPCRLRSILPPSRATRPAHTRQWKPTQQTRALVAMSPPMHSSRCRCSFPLPPSSSRRPAATHRSGRVRPLQPPSRTPPIRPMPSPLLTHLPHPLRLLSRNARFLSHRHRYLQLHRRPHPHRHRRRPLRLRRHHRRCRVRSARSGPQAESKKRQPQRRFRCVHDLQPGNCKQRRVLLVDQEHVD